MTEDDYVARNDGPYAWVNVMLHFLMREMPVLFIGCSLTIKVSAALECRSTCGGRCCRTWLWRVRLVK